MRDHDTLLDEARHQQVGKSVGDPGAVLADGRITGTWRPRKHCDTLTITVTSFGPLPARARTQLQGEAKHIAALRGATLVDVVCVTG